MGRSNRTVGEPEGRGIILFLSDFGGSVNLISNKGANYAHHSTTCPKPPGFLDLPTALHYYVHYYKERALHPFLHGRFLNTFRLHNLNQTRGIPVA